MLRIIYGYRRIIRISTRIAPCENIPSGHMRTAMTLIRLHAQSDQTVHAQSDQCPQYPLTDAFEIFGLYWCIQMSQRSWSDCAALVANLDLYCSNLQLTLVISTSLISNNRLSRSENLVLLKHENLTTVKKYFGKEEKLLLRSNFSSFPKYF